MCNFVVNLFSPGDLYWGSSNFRNQLFQVGSVNLSFCLHIWEHCQSSKSHDLLLASLPAMFLDIGWSSTCNNTSAQCLLYWPKRRSWSWWVMMGVDDQARISKNTLVFWPVSHTATVAVCIPLPPSRLSTKEEEDGGIVFSRTWDITYHHVACTCTCRVSFPTWDLYIRTWASSQRTTYMSPQR